MNQCQICHEPLPIGRRKYCSDYCGTQASNQNHNSYACQQRRARARKGELVNRLGGKCSRCGYDRNLAALHFHHVGPKSFGLDARVLSTSSMKRIEQELTKCILVCANCHAELHNDGWWVRRDSNSHVS